MMYRRTMILVSTLLVVCASVALVVLTPAHAQQADPGAAALTEMLRSLAVPGGGAGSSADQQVNALTGSPQLTQEVYALAGQILTELMQSSGGDMSKLSDTLKRAQTDPAGFVDSLSPQTRDRLRELSDKIAAARK